MGPATGLARRPKTPSFCCRTFCPSSGYSAGMEAGAVELRWFGCLCLSQRKRNLRFVFLLYVIRKPFVYVYAGLHPAPVKGFRENS